MLVISFVLESDYFQLINFSVSLKTILIFLILGNWIDVIWFEEFIVIITFSSRKGDAMMAAEVKECLTDYIKTNSLQDSARKR